MSGVARTRSRIVLEAVTVAIAARLCRGWMAAVT